MGWVGRRSGPWRPWQNLSVSEEDGRLVIRRRWQAHSLRLCLYETVVGAPLWGPWAASGWHHFLSPSNGLLAYFLYALLLGGPAVLAHRFRSRGRVYVFDRAHDYVTCDGRVVCALSEVQSVRVGEPPDWETRAQALGFLIHGRNEITLEWEDLAGAGPGELGQAGLALSVYARIPLWAEGEWRDPRDPSDGPPPVAAPDPTRQIRSTPRGRAPG